ncbi:BgtAcSP-30403 [Blumeria graminis f. sp. tritici]|uniref:BgtAcSP-30403 n=2 Tax=Blumeria graminis f. sp. tritici TaxID=62690 RepID=A0A381LC50_BLUGR|nr:BgtAcSP-30403 [Blumeria graminis f. sp. tritici]
MRMFMVFLGIMATKLVALPSDVHVKRSVNDHTIEYTMSQIPEQPNPEKKFRILGRDEKENSGRINDLVRTYSITPTGEHTDSLQKFSTPSNRLTRVMSEGLPGKHVKRGLHYKHFLGRPHWKHGPPHHHHRVMSRLGRLLPHRGAFHPPHWVHPPHHPHPHPHPHPHVNFRHPGRP